MNIHVSKDLFLKNELHLKDYKFQLYLYLVYCLPLKNLLMENFEQLNEIYNLALLFFKHLMTEL